MSVPKKNAAPGFVDESDPSSYKNPEKKASCKRAITQDHQTHKPDSSKQTSGEPCIEPQSEVVVVLSSGKKELTTFDKALEVPSQTRIDSIGSKMGQRPSALEKESKVLCGSDEMPTSSKFVANLSVPFVSQPSLMAKTASNVTKKLSEKMEKSSETDIFKDTVKKEMNKQSQPPKIEKEKVAYTYPSFGMIWSPLQSCFCLRHAATQSDGKNLIDSRSFQVVNEKNGRDIWRYVCYTAIGFACAVFFLAVSIPVFGNHLLEVIQHLFYGLPKPKTVIHLLQKFLSDLYEMLRK